MTPHELLQPAATDVKPRARQADRRDQAGTLLTQAAICERLDISDETWRRWVRCGRAPAALEGFPRLRPRWARSDVEAFELGRFTGPTMRHYFGTARRRRRAG